MRLAQIEGGIVINVIEADARPDWAADWPEADAAGPGWGFDGTTFTPPAIPPVDLAEARAAAIARINSAADSLRRLHVTAITGQDMIYLRKEAEARAWLADPAPDLAAYPLIAAEVGVTAPTAHELAQLWLNMAALWVAIAAPLETARLSGIDAVERAADPADLPTIVATTEAAIAAIAQGVPA